MVAVYVILGIFAFLIVYIAIKYSINTIKIKNKSKASKKDEKAVKNTETKDEKKADDKPKTFEQKTEFVDESAKEAAMRKAFEASKQKELEIKIEAKPTITNEMYDDENMTELEKELYASGKKRRYGREKNVIEQKHMSSETNQIGVEGPVKKEGEQIQAQSAENQNQIDVSKMTDDMKKILIADILNKKY